MEKTIILIRHGKAEPREGTADDSQRKLTQKGRKDLEKILPALKLRLGDRKLQLVSSRLPRAVQTAECIASAMGIQTFQLRDWVENGDYEGLREAYQNLAPGFTLVVVGHEPYLSDWSRQLCGFEIPFRKGGAASFRITSKEPLSALPEWMLLPETQLQELNIDPCAPAVSEFRKILRLSCHESFAFLQKFLEAPNDPATVHRFRISVRTFRAVLSFMKPLLNPNQYTAIQNQMRKLANQMGNLREIDVLKSIWKKLLKMHPLPEEGKSVLVAALTAERQTEQELVYGDASEMITTIFDALIWVENTLKPETSCAGKTEEAKPQSFVSFSKKRINSRLKKINNSVKGIADSDYRVIHQLRIRIKKLRYAVSILNPLLALGKEDTIASLKDLQDVLGDYCDTQRNLSILQKLSTQDDSAGMLYESTLLSGYQIRVMEESLDKIRAVNKIL